MADQEMRFSHGCTGGAGAFDPEADEMDAFAGHGIRDRREPGAGDGDVLSSHAFVVPLAGEEFADIQFDRDGEPVGGIDPFDHSGPGARGEENLIAGAHGVENGG
jgi:hypothetical protein